MGFFGGSSSEAYRAMANSFVEYIAINW